MNLLAMGVLGYLYDSFTTVWSSYNTVLLQIPTVLEIAVSFVDP